MSSHAKTASDLRRLRARLSRQRLALRKTRKRQHDDIRLALSLGASPTRLARAAGYSVSRIYQIRDEQQTPPENL